MQIGETSFNLHNSEHYFLEVSCFRILLWPMDNCYNENAFNQRSSTFSTRRLTKSSQKRWGLSVAYFNLPTTDFPRRYLQQLLPRSGSANHRLKNTILAPDMAFHLAPLTLQTKEMLSTSERTRSQRFHLKHYFVFTQQQNISPSEFSSGKKKSLWCYSLCKRPHSFTDGAAKWNTSAL